MLLITLLTSLLAAVSLTRASPVPTMNDAVDILDAAPVHQLNDRAIGVMRIPLYLGVLPPNMTFTIDEITETVPKGMRAYRGARPLPIKVSADEVATATKAGQRGVQLGTYELATTSALGGGQGASFLIKFTIAGRPSEANGTAVQDVKGTVTIGTSEWGTFGRPDNTIFNWQIANSPHGVYTAKTPTLTYLQDTVIAIAYAPENKAYMMGMTNQAPAIVKLMQTAVGGIVAGHALLWGAAAGMVGTIAGVAMNVVIWVPQAVNEL